MRNSLRTISASLTAALLWLVPSVCQADQPAQPDHCESVSISVLLGALAGTLCLPDSGPTGTVMVLMAGSNYNHTYWDFPYQPETYNFRRAMNAGGYATLVVDRLGNGASTRPPSATLTATGSAAALHQVVQALRHGLAGHQPFDKVITGGHSLSSGFSVLEAVTFHDVDGVLLTGYSHTLDYLQVGSVVSTYYPAILDPRFIGRGYDPGYLTTRPGTRAADFYGPGDFDPQVLATDEATKEVFSLTEYPDGLASTLPPVSNLIDVPVMVVDGSMDKLSCGPDFSICHDTAALQAAEAPYFSPAAHLRTYVLPGSGHSVNLALNTEDYQAAVLDWVNSTVR
ncbi:alpha/beta hydrolase [Nocardia pseudobrasiliensis]|uniref:Pimeloyl-ACP methyl ester carboxylesterase n=1 Tax=Nocardia pseudobrasiliensis TaxID=45979 RepID=A0A370I4A1_9NOCA|nr:alpha/beta fold hydrolase [Nocardia pseudobrasiliensis]RDI65573.1 pimeloyl-ACP methyl ester carboxylesterase [Nocardia pseudobrasiliensis]